MIPRSTQPNLYHQKPRTVVLNIEDVVVSRCGEGTPDPATRDISILTKRVISMDESLAKQSFCI